MIVLDTNVLGELTRPKPALPYRSGSTCTQRVVAAICRPRGAVLATRNATDFEGVGVEVVGPWTADLDADER